MSYHYHHTYCVAVGNIGRVHSGNNQVEAEKHFAEYVSQSKANYGRAAGESVTLYKDDEPIKDYIGTVES